MSKKRGLIFLVSMLALIFSVSLVSAQTEGIPIQKDVFLGAPISGPEDLPEKITFTLYGTQAGLTPLGKQTFPRGQYTVDFEFSQSDGVTGGSVARVKADFTQALNLKDAPGQPLKPKELWAGLEVAGTEVGTRTKVSDETLVRLLLNSDASLATYLTLAYEGDDNPITTIYKDLPISLTAADGSKKSLSDYFSAVVAGTADSRELGVAGSDGQIQYNNGGAEGGAAQFYYNDLYGRVGIGTATPAEMLNVTGNVLIGGTTKLHGGLYSLSITSSDTAAAYVVDLPTDTLSGRAFGFGATGESYIRGIFYSNGFIGLGPGYMTRDTFFGRSTANTIRIGSNYDGSGAGNLIVNGKVGIGTTDLGTYNLAVKGDGGIGCQSLTVTNTGWADFVFSEGYKLPSIEEVEQFIRENKHLSGIPTETEVKQRGVNVGEMTSKLLQKIEELTIYMIDIKKENDSLKTQLADIQAKVNGIK